MNIMIYGYCRVSTKNQARLGTSLEDQKLQILRKYPNAEIIEESYTGTELSRPEFNRLLDKLQPNDTLVVCKIDRLARSITAGKEVIEQLIDQGICIDILNLGVLDKTPQGKLIHSIFLAFAEFERDMIVERTQAGKEIAKTKAGYREGRPSLDDAKVELIRTLKASGKSVNAISKTLGVAPSTVWKYTRADESCQ